MSTALLQYRQASAERHAFRHPRLDLLEPQDRPVFSQERAQPMVELENPLALWVRQWEVVGAIWIPLA
jgi:hypothetical protein